MSLVNKSNWCTDSMALLWSQKWSLKPIKYYRLALICTVDCLTSIAIEWCKMLNCCLFPRQKRVIEHGYRKKSNTNSADGAIEIESIVVVVLAVVVVVGDNVWAAVSIHLLCAFWNFTLWTVEININVHLYFKLVLRKRECVAK